MTKFEWAEKRGAPEAWRNPDAWKDRAQFLRVRRSILKFKLREIRDLGPEHLIWRGSEKHEQPFERVDGGKMDPREEGLFGALMTELAKVEKEITNGL